MFDFLKEKLKSALKKFTEDVEEKSEKIAEKAEKKTAKEPVKEKAKKKETAKPKTEKPAKKEEKKAGKEEKEKKEQKKEIPQEKKAEIRKEEKKETEKPERETEKEEKEEEREEAEQEEGPEQKPEEKKGFFARLKGTLFKEKEEKEELQEEAKEEIEQPEEEKEPEPKKEEKGFFERIKDTITKTTLSEEKFNDLFWNIEVVLLENNVAVDVIDKIRDDLKATLVNQKIPRGKLEECVQETVRTSVLGLFDLPPVDVLARIRQKKEKPFIIAFVGINGSGKTTTIAKLAHALKKNHLTPVVAAADTFRAAAIQQLEEHGERLGVKVIKHDYGADPAAVAFDAIKYAKAKRSDVVLIDTAGRMHSNTNLIDEMKKIVRVSKPDLKIFVGESITGNDCIEQARTFNEAIAFDAIILTKADVDEKGGAALSVSYVTKKPITYFGVGQTYDDLEVFDKEKVMASIGL